MEYWRQRFAKEGIDKIFPTRVPEEKSPYHGKVDYYYEMSEAIPEDYALRQNLAMRRLEEVRIRRKQSSYFFLNCRRRVKNACPKLAYVSAF